MRLSDLSPELLATLEDRIDDALGFTLARAQGYLDESRAEAAAGDGETDVRADAIGKHKRFLRVDRHWQGLADAAWPFIERYAAANVDAVLAVEAEGGAG